MGSKAVNQNTERRFFFPTLLLIILGYIAVFAPVPDAPSFRDVTIVFIPLVFYVISHPVKLQNTSPYYFMIWGVAIISTMISVYVEFERSVATYFAFILMVVLFASFKFTSKEIRTFVNFYIMLAVISSGLIILSWIVGIPHGYNRYSIDVIGYSRNPNYINSVLILGTTFLLGRLFNGKSYKWLNIALFVFICFGVFLTGTRAAVIAIIGCLALTLLYASTDKKRIKFIFLYFLLVSVVAFILIKYVPDVISSRFAAENAMEDETRMYMWESNFGEFLKHPILGMGLGATAEHTSHLGLKVDYMHNVVLQFVYEHGLIGLLLLSLILFKIFKRAKSKDRFYLVVMAFAMYFPIMFQNGLVALTFWWPLVVLEVFSNTSHHYSLDNI